MLRILALFVDRTKHVPSMLHAILDLRHALLVHLGKLIHSRVVSCLVHCYH